MTPEAVIEIGQQALQTTLLVAGPMLLAGMAVGFAVQDRIDQAAFRKATLVVLLVAGGNLVRRGLMG